MRYPHPMLIPPLLTAMFSAGAALITQGGGDPGRGIIRLPQPSGNGVTSVEQALRQRRSVRSYTGRPLSLSELSQLLWAAQGINGREDRRTVPSAGALYPIEVYVVAGAVMDLSAGVYAYDPKNHGLRLIAEGDARPDLCRAALNQSPVRNAAADLVISAIEERTMVKYGRRGVRYVHMEAGHAAQNIYLQAAALGLGTVAIGAFDDDSVRRVVGMADREQPLYIMPVGAK